MKAIFIFVFLSFGAYAQEICETAWEDFNAVREELKEQSPILQSLFQEYQAARERYRKVWGELKEQSPVLRNLLKEAEETWLKTETAMKELQENTPDVQSLWEEVQRTEEVLNKSREEYIQKSPAFRDRSMIYKEFGILGSWAEAKGPIISILLPKYMIAIEDWIAAWDKLEKQLPSIQEITKGSHEARAAYEDAVRESVKGLPEFEEYRRTGSEYYKTWSELQDQSLKVQASRAKVERLCSED